ncbi:MAG: hypothetical protein ACE5J2_06460 [Nitrososphaerales archaeon]
MSARKSVQNISSFGGKIEEISIKQVVLDDGGAVRWKPQYPTCMEDCSTSRYTP